MIEIEENICVGYYIFIGESGKNKIKYKDNIFDIESFEGVYDKEIDSNIFYKVIKDKRQALFQHDERPFHNTAKGKNNINIWPIIECCESLLQEKN